jgi:hypothetical protein
MIELYNKQTSEMQTVTSWPTATPHFVITKPMSSTDSTIDVSGLFNVTHARSTAIALGPFYDLKIARVCAAVLGLLPMPWDEFSMAVSAEYRKHDPEQAKRFRTAWTSLPKEIHAWRKTVSDACMCGEL